MKKLGFPLLLLAIVGVLVGIFMLGGGTTKSDVKAPTARQSSDGLEGLQTGNAPWSSNIEKLRSRLSAIGLPALSAEGTVLHIHQHLDMYIDGQKVEVPQGIGTNEKEGFISDLHTHDTGGIMHVESANQQDFYLGQFFDIWGVKLGQGVIGGYKSGDDKKLSIYVNGKPYNGDPRQLKLESHQEIVVSYGTESQLPSPIPETFAFSKDQ